MTKNARVGTGVVIFRDGKVLLTLRNKGANNRAGLWELPGGTVEGGEDIFQTAIREVYEETDLRITPTKVVSVHQDFVKDQHWISFGVLAEAQGILENKEPHKFDDISFVDLYNLPENTGVLTKEVIIAALSKEEINMRTLRC